MSYIETGIALKSKRQYKEHPAQYARGYALGAQHRYIRVQAPPPVVDSFTEGYHDGISGKYNRYGG